MIPFQDLLRYDPTAGTAGEVGDPMGGVKQTLRNLAWQISPIIKTPIEVAFGKQLSGYGAPFTGKPQSVPQPLRSLPGLMPALSNIGLARKVDDEWMMDDHTLYMVLNAMPVWGTIRRLLPSEEKYQEKFFESAFSSLAGLSVKRLTPKVEKSYKNHLLYLKRKSDREAGVTPYRSGVGRGGRRQGRYL